MINPHSPRRDDHSENTAQGVKTPTRPNTRSTRFLPVKPEPPDHSRETKIQLPDHRHLENPSSQIHAINAITAINSSHSPLAKTGPSKRSTRSTPGTPLSRKPDHPSDNAVFKPTLSNEPEPIGPPLQQNCECDHDRESPRLPARNRATAGRQSHRPPPIPGRNPRHQPTPPRPAPAPNPTSPAATSSTRPTRLEVPSDRSARARTTPDHQPQRRQPWPEHARPSEPTPRYQSPYSPSSTPSQPGHDHHPIPSPPPDQTSRPLPFRSEDRRQFLEPGAKARDIPTRLRVPRDHPRRSRASAGRQDPRGPRRPKQHSRDSPNPPNRDPQDPHPGTGDPPHDRLRTPISGCHRQSSSTNGSGTTGSGDTSPGRSDQQAETDPSPFGPRLPVNAKRPERWAPDRYPWDRR